MPSALSFQARVLRWSFQAGVLVRRDCRWKKFAHPATPLDARRPSTTRKGILLVSVPNGRFQESPVYCTDLPCEAVGFARVGGFTTVKIVAERHLHGQDLQACIVRTMRSAPLPKGRGAGDLDAAIKTAVERGRSRT